MRLRTALGAAATCAVLLLGQWSTKSAAAKGAAAKPTPGKETAAPENAVQPPLTSDDLTERARHLFDAVVRDDPELADDFFFPREPFLRLKDVDDPGRYHAELVRMYRRDVHSLHARRRNWDGARFVSFELGTAPRWVKPGEEWNKIGYHRTFDGKLRYDHRGTVRTLDVHTIISWDGQWYVTHLLPTKR